MKRNIFDLCTDTKDCYLAVIEVGAAETLLRRCGVRGHFTPGIVLGAARVAQPGRSCWQITGTLAWGSRETCGVGELKGKCQRAPVWGVSSPVVLD